MSSLHDELQSEEMFDNLEDARRMLALWRYDHNNVRPLSSLGNHAPAEARRTLEQIEGSAPGALAQNETREHEHQTCKLSLGMREPGGRSIAKTACLALTHSMTTATVFTVSATPAFVEHGGNGNGNGRANRSKSDTLTAERGSSGNNAGATCR